MIYVCRGVSKDGQTIYELNNVELGGKVNTSKSGQKVSTQNWLNLYLRKVLLNPKECNKAGTMGKEPEPVIDPVTGQKFPPPPRQEPNFGKFWAFPFK